ncbi:epidermal growth factor receptor kinase substrate 8-like protein 3 [Hemicordylus capensis]|uniref:epidermal growth factor receptor kinase substrate 8-like protein 3 n=1 Tax=Hemicordylus capensis TaxID=884348 RepID=UPI002303C410|nr:epidermal growth factor receptor kinase substrate 8-like protein 3 [Hemicordylus capensis]
MADLFGRRDNIYHNETETTIPRANSMSRPSGKAIYRQRKEYAELMAKQQNEFQYRVEHLFTGYVDGKDICNTESCISQLKMMDAQGQVWGQDMLLNVKNHKLLLTDTEAEEELDCYPLESIQECTCILDSCIYNSILAITVKEMRPHRTSIMLFQCEQIGAELLKTKVEKAIEEWRGEQQSQDFFRNNLENMLSQHSRPSINGKPPRLSQDRRAPGPMGMDHAPSPAPAPWQQQEEHPWKASPVPLDYRRETEQALGRQQKDEPAREESELQMKQDERNVEILNHVLSDIEVFAEKVQRASGSLSNKKKKNQKKKNQGNEALPLQPEFKECFQKIKYSFNLLAKLEHTMQQPSAPEMIHLIFSTLSTILSNCPWAELAPAVALPLLIPSAIDLLSRSLDSAEQLTWRSLGAAWNLSRAEHPDGQSIPPYKPTFSDGWVLPEPIQKHNSMDLTYSGNQNTFSDRASDPPQVMQAMYEFHARNSRELTVRKGDLLEVLDQRKKWWLARNTSGEKGYIPNNILEPLEQKPPKGDAMEQVSRGFPDLQPSSTPAEVTLWLRSKGFSKITVKSLGILNGRQLLSMSQEELKTVCPEEGRRVFLMLMT